MRIPSSPGDDLTLESPLSECDIYDTRGSKDDDTYTVMTAFQSPLRTATACTRSRELKAAGSLGRGHTGIDHTILQDSTLGWLRLGTIQQWLTDVEVALGSAQVGKVLLLLRLLLLWRVF